MFSLTNPLRLQRYVICYGLVIIKNQNEIEIPCEIEIFAILLHPVFLNVTENVTESLNFCLPTLKNWASVTQLTEMYGKSCNRHPKWARFSKNTAPTVFGKKKKYKRTKTRKFNQTHQQQAATLYIYTEHIFQHCEL